MQLALKVDHREIEVNTGGSLWLRTTFREVHVTRDLPGAPLWPRLESEGKHSGVWSGFGWRLAYDRPEGAPPARATK